MMRGRVARGAGRWNPPGLRSAGARMRPARSDPSRPYRRVPPSNKVAAFDQQQAQGPQKFAKAAADKAGVADGLEFVILKVGGGRGRGLLLSLRAEFYASQSNATLVLFPGKKIDDLLAWEERRTVLIMYKRGCCPSNDKGYRAQF